MNVIPCAAQIAIHNDRSDKLIQPSKTYEHKLTKISIPFPRLHPSKEVFSSSGASMTSSLPAPPLAAPLLSTVAAPLAVTPAAFRRSSRRCAEGGMPVTGSSLDLSRAMVHDTAILRSEEEFGEVICREMSWLMVHVKRLGCVT